jgi:sensor histidine kinase regulating citrate/malate metabolism
MINKLFDFTIKNIYLLWAVIIIIIMSTFLFIQLQQSKNQMEFNLSERAISVAHRVANSVSPTVWEIYQKSKDRHYSKSIASGILDSELSADFLIGPDSRIFI